MDSSPPNYIYPGINGLLPDHVKELLNNWPTRGQGGERARHKHILTIANRLRHYVKEDEAVKLIRDKMPRRPKGREIEQTVARAYNLKKVPKTDQPPTHRVDIGLIEDIVAERIGAKTNALPSSKQKAQARSPVQRPRSFIRCLIPRI